MEDTQSKPNFTHKDIKNIFYLSNSTIRTYIKEGILPFPELEDGEHVFSRELVLKALGLKELPAEPFIGMTQVLNILKLSANKNGVTKVGYLCRKNILPHYRLNSVKGSAYLFLESEISACMQYKMKRVPSSFELIASRKHIVKELFKKLLAGAEEVDERSIQIATKVIVDGQTLERVGKKVNLTKERIRQILDATTNELLRQAQNFNPALVSAQQLQIEQLTNEINYLKSKERINEKQPELSLDELTIIHKRIWMSDCPELLSVRAFNLLNKIEVKTIAELSLRKRTDIKKMMGCGLTTLIELDNLLEKHGLEWVPEGW